MGVGRRSVRVGNVHLRWKPGRWPGALGQRALIVRPREWPFVTMGGLEWAENAPKECTDLTPGSGTTTDDNASNDAAKRSPLFFYALVNVRVGQGKERTCGLRLEDQYGHPCSSLYCRSVSHPGLLENYRDWRQALDQHSA